MLTLLLGFAPGAASQEKLSPDTLECHVVGFTAGVLTPVAGSSTGLAGGNMADLYDSPYIDFNLDWAYKYANRWMLTFDGDFWFGSNSDNLKQREVRLGDVYSFGGYAMSFGGYDGVVTAYNRGLSARPGVAYIVPVLPGNPNSGILLKMSAGWMTQKTVFNQDYDRSPVPQLMDDYAKLYDHLRNGIMLSQSVGFLYMSNYLTFVNFKVCLEVSECWSWSSRAYQIDNVMGLNGKDRGRYFDLLVGLRINWMFPFTGKTSYDYYYY